MKNFKHLTKSDRAEIFEQALDQACPSRVVDRVVENHDWNSNPRMYTKQIAGWAKNNVVLECWNQWLAYEEAVTRGLYPGTKGHEVLGEMTRLEQAEMFHAYFTGYLKGIRESIEEDQEDE